MLPGDSNSDLPLIIGGRVKTLKKQNPALTGRPGFDIPSIGGIDLVGLAGFEPTTPTPPVWCATRLRYSPSSPLAASAAL